MDELLGTRAQPERWSRSGHCVLRWGARQRFAGDIGQRLFCRFADGDSRVAVHFWNPSTSAVISASVTKEGNDERLVHAYL